MLNKFFSKPVELTVGEHVLRFCSIPDFEFCLSGRTSVPSRKITDLVKLSTSKLKNEAITIKDIEKRFVAILSRSIEDPDSINQALRELDTTIFSQDHSWRSIIAALNEGGDEFNPFRRVALVKYMQYLASRQEIVKYLYSEKQSLSQAAKVMEENDEAGDKLSGTLILESTLFEPYKDDKVDEFERMPKGEVISLKLADGKEVEIRLSKHKCKLSNKHGIVFIDQAGKEFPLIKGKNVIGRDTSSTVKIDSSLRDISRLHLLIENVGNNHLQLTDMSSHGTFMHPAQLAQHTVA
jgi:FHA domain